jgi:hypothetical protein
VPDEDSCAVEAELLAVRDRAPLVTHACLRAIALTRRLRQLRSSAAVSEAGQNMICVYLSVALLAGLLANAIASWWWADPAAALVIAAVAANEGAVAWRGDSCDCC